MLVGLALSALLAQPAAAEKDKSIEKPAIPSWYTQTFARGDAGLNVTYLWSLKSKFRAETVIRGHKLVTIVNGETYYVYDALTMKPESPFAARPQRWPQNLQTHRPFGNEAQILIDEGGEKIREESIAGRAPRFTRSPMTTAAGSSG